MAMNITWAVRGKMHPPVQGRRLKVAHVVGLNSATESPVSAQGSQEVMNANSSNGNEYVMGPEAQSTGEEHPVFQQLPTEWFGPLADELLALQPQKLGKVILSAKPPVSSALSRQQAQAQRI